MRPLCNRAAQIQRAVLFLGTPMADKGHSQKRLYFQKLLPRDLSVALNAHRIVLAEFPFDVQL
eukprot:6241305-Amphidinium_carterae.1